MMWHTIAHQRVADGSPSCCGAVNMMTLMLSVLDEVVDGMSISLAGVSGQTLGTDSSGVQ
jgi:hypothetical protein